MAEIRQAVEFSTSELLGAYPHRDQFWGAVRILHRLNRVFRRQPTHHQGQFAVRCRLNGKPVHPQNVLRSVSTAAVYFHDKLDIFHGSFPFLERLSLYL